MPSYKVIECADDPSELVSLMNNATANAGRVISVTWQPARTLKLRRRTVLHAGGFTIVVEAPDAG